MSRRADWMKPIDGVAPAELLEAYVERERWITMVRDGCDYCRGSGVYTCERHVFTATERDLAKAKLLRLLAGVAE